MTAADLFDALRIGGEAAGIWFACMAALGVLCVALSRIVR